MKEFDEIQKGPERTLLSFMEDPVIVLSAKGVAAYMNPAFIKRFDSNAGLDLGRHVSEILPAWMWEPISDQLAAITPGGAPRRFWLSNDRFRFRASMGIITLEGRAAGAVLTLWDATSELNQKRKNLELFRSMLTNFEYPMLEMNSIVARPDHRTEYVDASFGELLGQFEEGFYRMRDFGELLFGEFRSESVPFHPNRLLALARKSFRPIAEERGVYLEEAACRDLPQVVGDPALLNRVLAILVDFMIRRTQKGENVVISADLMMMGDGSATLGYAITGTGVVSPELEMVGSEFSLQDALGATSEKDKQRVLRVALARRLTTTMGGELTVAAHESVGTTLFARAPVKIHFGD